MNIRYCLLYTSISLIALQAAADDWIIGVDFGNVEGETLNWNTLAEPKFQKRARLLDTQGNVVDGVSLEVMLPGPLLNSGRSKRGVGQNDMPEVSQTFTSIPSIAQEDWWFENIEAVNSGYTFEFSGLDDSKSYELIIGAYNPDIDAARIANGSTTWMVGNQTLTTKINRADASYVTFTELVPVGSLLTIRSLDNDGNKVSAVAALQLTQQDRGEKVDVPEPSGSVLLTGCVTVVLTLLCRRRTHLEGLRVWL